MKARLASKIGKRIVISFTKQRIVLSEVYTIDTNLEDVRHVIETVLEDLKDLGHISAWGMETVYDTPSGNLEPGCLFWNDWLPKNHYFDNQIGPMLMAVLPNGHHWNIDSRASNCTKQNDRNHRCWCRHGEVPNITVDKIGNTCSAGAGSIAVPGWHGFLKNGEFVKC